MSSLLLAALLLAPVSQDMAVQRPLIVAIKSRDVAAVARLLKAGANPNAREILTSKPNFSDGIKGGRTFLGDTAITLAIDQKSLKIVKLLLDHGVDPNGRGDYGYTPLMLADTYEIVALLLKKGAKPNLRNENGDTAITFAANVNRVKIVNLLIKYGADMNGGTGESALVIASMSGAKETVRLLLKHGADPNFHRKPFLPPLEYARRDGDDEIAEMLVRAGGKGRSAAVIQHEEKEAFRKATLHYEKKARDKQKAQIGTEKLTAEDVSVIDKVLFDILSYKGWEVRSPDNLKAPNIIIFDSTSTSSEGTESEMNTELTERQANDIDLHMRQDLLKRNISTLSISGTKFSPHILLKKTEVPSFGDPFKIVEEAHARCWVEVMLPGYSADGSKAIIRLIYGPTAHGARGTYLLAKRNGKWIVVWRVFRQYV